VGVACGERMFGGAAWMSCVALKLEAAQHLAGQAVVTCQALIQAIMAGEVNVRNAQWVEVNGHDSFTSRKKYINYRWILAGVLVDGDRVQLLRSSLCTAPT
jgi:hypothetical protein